MELVAMTSGAVMTMSFVVFLIALRYGMNRVVIGTAALFFLSLGGLAVA